MPHIVKKIPNDQASVMLFQCTWMVEETMCFRELVICERAVLTAPEGKAVTLIVNGIVKQIKPGKYMGHVVLKVSDPYAAAPAGLMAFNEISPLLAPAICVENGGLSEGKCIPEAVWGGEYNGNEARDIYLCSDAESFNGIVVQNSDFRIEEAKFDLYGNSYNDYIGEGAGVLIAGKSNVTIADSQFNLSGVTRCAIHVGGDSSVAVDNCDIINLSPDSDWLGSFSWNLPLRGTNRLCQLMDNGQVLYNNCRLKSNGWGILSIDGSDEFVRIVVKDSKLELSGPATHGYGVFGIGPAEVVLDHSIVDVYGYPLFVMGMGGAGKADVINGSVLKGRRFGVMLMRDDCSIVTLKDSAIDTEKANIVAKGSTTQIDITNCQLRSKAGVILQMMDNEESTMDMTKFFVPIGVEDRPIEGRDLTSVELGSDLILNLSDMAVEGDFYNSTSNIRAYRGNEEGGKGKFHDTLVGPVPFREVQGDSEEGGPVLRGTEELNGPKNLGIYLKNTSVTGIISAAIQHYREGVTEISAENWFELANITQTAAPTVNNGVIVTMDSSSAWTVTGTSYLTSLSIAEGAVLRAEGGKALCMTVDGVEAEILPGHYEGKIVISLV